MENARLVVSNLKKTYGGDVRALKGVSFSAGSGIFGLLGPNGAGKTTLMNCLATLQQPDSGSITFDGVDVRADKNALRRRLGYLPQYFGVYPRSTAHDLLDFFSQLKGVADATTRRRHVEALLDRVNLTHVAHRAVETFSGGMRQRFGIAQALIGNPSLIIVDEPTAGLDPTERNRFQLLLGEIAEDAVVLLSTHIVEDIASLCHDLIVLNQGEVVAAGKPQQLTNKLCGKLWHGSVGPHVNPSSLGAVRVISTRMTFGEKRLVLESEKPPEGFAEKTPTLEDVYFSSIPSPGLACAV